MNPGGLPGGRRFAERFFFGVPLFVLSAAFFGGGAWFSGAVAGEGLPPRFFLAFSGAFLLEGLAEGFARDDPVFSP